MAMLQQQRTLTLMEENETNVVAPLSTNEQCKQKLTELAEESETKKPL
jgi:uncharacterized protein (DUF1778 family)